MLKGTENALLTPTGFAANLSIVGLCAPLAKRRIDKDNQETHKRSSTIPDDGRVALFSDELNHASIIDACAMAGKKGAAVYM